MYILLYEVFIITFTLQQDPYHYEKTGVTVITLCPGLTETALTVDSPNKLLSRVMKADFVKNLEQFLIQT